MADVRIIRPRATPDQIAEVRAQSDAWWDVALDYLERAEAGRLPQDVAERATVSATALELVSKRLASHYVDRENSLLALEGDRIVGAVVYTITSPDAVEIEWMGVYPPYLSGAPGRHQVRGVGTSLVCETARRLLAEGAHRIMLTPYDAAAREFWEHRGFHESSRTAPGDLAVEGPSEVRALANACMREPDAEPLVCVCGTASEMRRLVGAMR